MTGTSAARLVRSAAVAGSFYPAEPGTLRHQVKGFLTSVEAVAAPAIAIIVPHAGYEFSGRCAAEVFGRVLIPRTVVLLGPNHYGATGRVGGAGVWQAGAFATPLGALPIDDSFARALIEACPLVAHDPLAHRGEHALEVQLPFLVVQAAPALPAIVPLVLSWDDWPRCRELARALAALVRSAGPENVLLLASSDMTHFEPAAEALRHDEPALAAIRRLDGEGLLRECDVHCITMCGAAPVAVVLEAARELGARRADVIAHTHSGLVTGDCSSVVSYAGIVIR